MSFFYDDVRKLVWYRNEISLMSPQGIQNHSLIIVKSESKYHVYDVANMSRLSHTNEIILMRESIRKSLVFGWICKYADDIYKLFLVYDDGIYTTFAHSHANGVSISMSLEIKMLFNGMISGYRGDISNKDFSVKNDLVVRTYGGKSYVLDRNTGQFGSVTQASDPTGAGQVRVTTLDGTKWVHQSSVFTDPFSASKYSFQVNGSGTVHTTNVLASSIIEKLQTLVAQSISSFITDREMQAMMTMSQLLELINEGLHSRAKSFSITRDHELYDQLLIDIIVRTYSQHKLFKVSTDQGLFIGYAGI